MTHNHIIPTALIIVSICTIIPLFLFHKYDLTPVELLTDGKTDECKEELVKMYKSEEGAERRYQDIYNVTQLTDKYKVSLFNLLCLPANYRYALIIGIMVGVSQGIINAFFDGFLCESVDSIITSAYCKQTLYSPTSNFSYMLFFYILVIAPTIAFILYFECNLCVL